MKSKILLMSLSIMLVYIVTFSLIQERVNECEQDLSFQLRVNKNLVDGINTTYGDEYKSTIRDYYENSCESWNLCKIKASSLDFNLAGVYKSEGFYCVNTKGESTSDIATTEQHEICHALIDKDKSHFCKGEEVE